MLTGGGDCPGLNAVIRAVVRRAHGYGDGVIGFRDGWRGPIENDDATLTLEARRGILPRGGTILGSSRTNPFKGDGGVDARARDAGSASPRRADRDRRRGHARRAAKLFDAGRERRGRAEDDRQRPRRHRHDVRLRHRGADRDRRDRPPAHHGRVPQPRHDRRGDGPPRGLDRAALGPRRRRRRDPRSPSSRSTSTRSARADRAAPRARPPLLDRRRRRGRAARRRATMERSAARPTQFGHARLGGIGQRLEQEIEQRTGFETRATVPRPHPARRDADGVRPRARHAARASRRSTRRTTAAGGRWRRCSRRRSRWWRCRRRRAAAGAERRGSAIVGRAALE